MSFNLKTAIQLRPTGKVVYDMHPLTVYPSFSESCHSASPHRNEIVGEVRLCTSVHVNANDNREDVNTLINRELYYYIYGEIEHTLKRIYDDLDRVDTYHAKAGIDNLLKQLERHK